MNLNTKKSFRIPKIKLPKLPGSTTPLPTPQATEPHAEQPAVLPETVTPQRAKPPRQWPTGSRRASWGAKSSTIGQGVQPGWIGTHPVYGEPIATPPRQDSGPDSSSPSEPSEEPPRIVTLEQRVQQAGERLQATPLLNLLTTLHLSGETLGEQELVPLLALCANKGLSLRVRRALFKATVAMLPPLPEGGGAHRLCFSWIGSTGKPAAQDRWRAIYDQRAQPIQLQAASEDAQSLLPPDDWIF